MNISIGKLRGIQEIADDRGFLTVCALDHRAALRHALNEKQPEAITYRQMVDFKLDLCRVVVGSASAVLLDPQYGAAQAVARAVLPGRIGLLVSLEETGYSGESTARLSRLLPGWSVKKAKRMGASAVKLLIYFRPDIKEIAKKQLELISGVAADCLAEDIPLLVETLSYPVASEVGQLERFAAGKPELVIETARQVAALPVDVLKVEFPADMRYEKDEGRLVEYCRQLDGACRLPWVILSGGEHFDVFKKQVEIASAAGASGFLAGRALWQEGARIESKKARMDFFENTTRKRLEELTALVHRLGKPWYAKYGSTAGEFEPIAEDWYSAYPEG
ncbi:MAG: tagatose 1,6-diphosphate aldolase [Dehalococcoidales bacterium]|nr:tagatose 1,6-diphosphate aldolase [Dehalococcoidales bacterium]